MIMGWFSQLYIMAFTYANFAIKLINPGHKRTCILLCCVVIMEYTHHPQLEGEGALKAMTLWLGARYGGAELAGGGGGLISTDEQLLIKLMTPVSKHFI